jgi:hypothetical protein
MDPTKRRTMANTSKREAVEALSLLFLLEIDFHSRARTAALRPEEYAELHASFAIQYGYERRIAGARGVTAADLERLTVELTPAADPGDVLRAEGSLRSILDL